MVISDHKKKDGKRQPINAIVDLYYEKGFSMTAINFYHLTINTLSEALPKLLEKVLENKLRALVVTDSEERSEEISKGLWTYHPQSFLPHGTKKDGRASEQPIWISAEPINENKADVLILTNDVSAPDVSSYQRVLDIFDGNNPESVTLARERWKTYKDQGHSPAYWQQDDNGKWQQASV